MITPPGGAGSGRVTVNSAALPSATLASATEIMASSSRIGTETEPVGSMPPERPLEVGARVVVPKAMPTVRRVRSRLATAVRVKVAVRAPAPLNVTAGCWALCWAVVSMETPVPPLPLSANV